MRLALDALWPHGPITMYFGNYFLLPLVMAWIGLRRDWGPIGWRAVALSMVVVAAAVWGIGNAIAYSTGQVMEWTHGRFSPGTAVVAADGSVEYEGARAAPVQDTLLEKLGQGALHGVLSTLAASVWCVVLGTVLIWLPARVTSRRIAH